MSGTDQREDQPSHAFLLLQRSRARREPAGRPAGRRCRTGGGHRRRRDGGSDRCDFCGVVCVAGLVVVVVVGDLQGDDGAAAGLGVEPADGGGGGAVGAEEEVEEVGEGCVGVCEAARAERSAEVWVEHKVEEPADAGLHPEGVLGELVGRDGAEEAAELLPVAPGGLWEIDGKGGEEARVVRVRRALAREGVGDAPVDVIGAHEVVERGTRAPAIIPVDEQGSVREDRQQQRGCDAQQPVSPAGAGSVSATSPHNISHHLRWNFLRHDRHMQRRVLLHPRTMARTAKCRALN
jgi:hypothetical protein